MGIQRLRGVLGQRTLSSFATKRRFNELRHKWVAVDVSIYAYKGIHSAKNASTQPQDIPQLICKTLLGLLISLLAEQILPVFVFDPPRTSKRGAMSREVYIPAQDMFSQLAIPYLVAAREAEALCCLLYQKGLVAAIMTTDTDVLLFNCPYIVFSAKHTHFMETTPASILSYLELSHTQFIDLALMLGTDFSECWRGKGPKAILRLVKEHGRLENITMCASMRQLYISQRGDFQLCGYSPWSQLDLAAVTELYQLSHLLNIKQARMCCDQEDVAVYLNNTVGLSNTVSKNRARKLFEFKKTMSLEGLLWFCRVPSMSCLYERLTEGTAECL